MALNYCQKSIAVAKQNKNKFQEATSYRAIFNIYHNLNMNDSAVKYAVYSIKLTTEIGDTANIAVNYGNLCWMYMDLNQYDKAIDYGRKGIEAGGLYADTVGMLVSVNNLALCYLRMGNNGKAIELFEKQLNIGKRINRARSIRNALVNLGTIYYNTGNISELEKVTALLNDYNNSDPNLDNKNKCLQYINTAYSYIYHKNFKQAEVQLLLALKIAEADSLMDQLLNTYLTLSKVEFAQHNFVKGNFYENKWDALDEKNNATELAEYAAELETKYEVEKKSAKILLQEAQLREKSILNYMITGAGLCILIISFLTYRALLHKHRFQKQRIIELETQQQLTATEAVLKGEEQERTRIAQDLHDGLGGMLCGIKYSFTTMKGNLIMTPDNHQAFERGMDMLDSSIKEMRRVAHNMMPEALVRFGLDTALKDFCNEINQSGALAVNYQSIGMADTSLDQTISITIYRIVQELLNNTMKHARAKSVIVQLTKTEKQLTITVEDDGKGFDTNILKVNKGIGWLNIQNRVEFLKGKLDITSHEGEGTSVQIEINA
jgi:signal transduction histidine kinase